MMRPVEIAGGGLAGLSLGIALRQASIPVTLHEAGEYPRHRVCGEFITGLDSMTRRVLGLDSLLADAARHECVVWHWRDRAIKQQTLPSPALALSRYRLDQRLAEIFVASGGVLHTHSRLDLNHAPPGRIFATGRRRTPGPWLGLKLHVRDLPLSAGLEIHLGEQAYVGLCRVEDGRVNVAGLFKRRPGLDITRAGALGVYLAAAGLPSLARRIESGSILPESQTAVAGLRFGPLPLRRDRMELGDAYAMIAPFTGNGMTMALQSAALALEPLREWSGGKRSWNAAVASVNGLLRQKFRLRLASSQALHPFLLQSRRQRWLVTATRSGLLPLRPLYHALH